MSNDIHPTVILEGDVRFGNNNRVGPYTVLIGPMTIGDDNVIGPHVCIGTPAQDTRNPRYDASGKRVEIGNRNIIREFTAIHKALDTAATIIGSGVHIMQSVHVPHDARIQDEVTLTSFAVLGGNAKVLRGANLGLGVMVHQGSVIGHYTMIGMGAAINKNVRPFCKHVPGPPTVNVYAIKKFGFADHEKEIADYVLSRVAPRSEVVKRIVDEFEALHQASGRQAY